MTRKHLVGTPTSLMVGTFSRDEANEAISLGTWPTPRFPSGSLGAAVENAAVAAVDGTFENRTLALTGLSYDVQFTTYAANQTISANTNLGSVTNDDKGVVAKYLGDLTVDATRTLSTLARKKGLVIYVKGNLYLNGSISMTAKGSNAAGATVFVDTGISIGAVGGAGGTVGAAAQDPGGQGVSGNITLSCAGGGAGGNAQGTAPGAGGAGSAGTSWCGGSGGGGGSTYATGAAGTTGAAGGAGATATAAACGGGGGGGGLTGGAAGAGNGGGGAGTAGTAGLAGLLIVIVEGNVTVANTGRLSSMGSRGGAGGGGGSGGGAGGGGAGGGCIVLLHGGTLSLATPTILTHTYAWIQSHGGSGGIGNNGAFSGGGGNGGHGAIVVAPIGARRTIFHYTGAAQNFTVPVGVTSITAYLWGAQGGDICHSYTGSDASSYVGSPGGYQKATLPVTPGQVIQVNVGGKGISISNGAPAGALQPGAAGGWNGGGAGGGNNQGATRQAGAGGGGATDLRTGAYALADRILVAGGGGGSSGASAVGGFGGYSSTPGGTGTAGTAGDSASDPDGVAGALGTGGAGGGPSYFGGGGGGGGFYGGGGGGSGGVGAAIGGGGGSISGSGFAPGNAGGGGGGGGFAAATATNISGTIGMRVGHGLAVITW